MSEMDVGRGRMIPEVLGFWKWKSDDITQSRFMGADEVVCFGPVGRLGGGDI